MMPLPPAAVPSITNLMELKAAIVASFGFEDITDQVKNYVEQSLEVA